MRFTTGGGNLLFAPHRTHDLLLDLWADPGQETPIVDPTAEQTGSLREKMIALMRENDCP